MGHDHEDMVPREAAVETVVEVRREQLNALPVETVDLRDVAGRTLAGDVTAPRDVPEHDHATMDGYAFDATDEYPLRVQSQEVFPEIDPPSIDPGEAVPIATGAPLPPEANAVLKREEATVTDGELRGAEIAPGTYRYEKASNVEAGERLFDRYETLSPKDALLLCDIGREAVEVRERFSVGILATGTEIHEGRQRDLDSAMRSRTRS